jgi:hypothetical protein
MVPPFVVELLGQNQITSPFGMASSECLEMSKAGSGSSDGGVDSGASPPPTVAVELQAIAGLPASPSVAKGLLAVAEVEDSPSIEVLTPEI